MEQGGAEASQHMVHHWPGFLICNLIVCESREEHIFPFPRHRRISFFPAFRKERQHFLSQNNLSLCLTRLPAIFTQLKLQMIYFQLHYSPALWHMVLSITPVTTEHENKSGETPSQTERAKEKMERKKTWENRRKGPEKPNSDFLCWLAFVVRGSWDIQQSELNYCAFIK